MPASVRPPAPQPVTLLLDGAEVRALLTVPDDARGLVVFAHHSGHSRLNLKNQELAALLNDASLATLLCDLLTHEEEVLDEVTGEFRNDAMHATRRLVSVVDWCQDRRDLTGTGIGLFGAGTGAAAAVMCSAARRHAVRALVLRGGKLDLAWSVLPAVDVPTLLIAGELDGPVRAGYSLCLARLGARIKQLVVVPGAGPLFLEPGTRRLLGEHVARWFTSRLGPECAATATGAASA